MANGPEIQFRWAPAYTNGEEKEKTNRLAKLAMANGVATSLASVCMAP